MDLKTHIFFLFYPFLNIYKSFIDSMDNLVENDQINAWEALPYDWRLSPDVLVRRGIEDFNGKY
jgi:hypothetical protein